MNKNDQIEFCQFVMAPSIFEWKSKGIRSELIVGLFSK